MAKQRPDVAAQPLPKAHFVYDFFNMMSTDNSACYQGFSQTKSPLAASGAAEQTAFFPFTRGLCYVLPPASPITTLRGSHRMRLTAALPTILDRLRSRD
jgi:hypothetical protein